jgi:hypothetical protein
MAGTASAFIRGLSDDYIVVSGANKYTVGFMARQCYEAALGSDNPDVATAQLIASIACFAEIPTITGTQAGALGVLQELNTVAANGGLATQDYYRIAISTANQVNGMIRMDELEVDPQTGRPADANLSFCYPRALADRLSIPSARGAVAAVAEIQNMTRQLDDELDDSVGNPSRLKQLANQLESRTRYLAACAPCAPGTSYDTRAAANLLEAADSVIATTKKLKSGGTAWSSIYNWFCTIGMRSKIREVTRAIVNVNPAH